MSKLVSYCIFGLFLIFAVSCSNDNGVKNIGSITSVELPRLNIENLIVAGNSIIIQDEEFTKSGRVSSTTKGIDVKETDDTETSISVTTLLDDYLMFFLMGLAALCVGLYLLFMPLYRKLTCRIKTTAKVVYVEVGTCYTEGRRTHVPIISYNANGVQMSSHLPLEWRSRFYEIGYTFTLFYNSKNSNKIYTGGISWGRTLFGLFGTVIGILILWVLAFVFPWDYLA